jgi:hypothetical protein
MPQCERILAHFAHIGAERCGAKGEKEVQSSEHKVQSENKISSYEGGHFGVCFAR